MHQGATRCSRMAFSSGHKAQGGSYNENYKMVKSYAKSNGYIIKSMLSRSSLFAILATAFALPQSTVVQSIGSGGDIQTVINGFMYCGGRRSAFFKAQCWRSDNSDAVWVGNLDSMPYHCEQGTGHMNVDNWRDGSKCNGQFPACEGRCFMKNE